MTSPRALLYFCFLPCKSRLLSVLTGAARHWIFSTIVPCLQSSGGLTQAFDVQCALYLGIVIKHNWVYTIQ